MGLWQPSEGTVAVFQSVCEKYPPKDRTVSDVDRGWRGCRVLNVYLRRIALALGKDICRYIPHHLYHKLHFEQPVNNRLSNRVILNLLFEVEFIVQMAMRRTGGERTDILCPRFDTCCTTSCKHLHFLTVPLPVETCVLKYERIVYGGELLKIEVFFSTRDGITFLVERSKFYCNLTVERECYTTTRSKLNRQFTGAINSCVLESAFSLVQKYKLVYMIYNIIQNYNIVADVKYLIWLDYSSLIFDYINRGKPFLVR